MASTVKQEIKDMFTRDIDAEIAALTARKAQMVEAAQAHIAALDRVDDLRNKVKQAEGEVSSTRKTLVEYGLKARGIKDLVAQIRGEQTPAAEQPELQLPADAAVGLARQ